MIKEAISEKTDQTDPKGAILSESFAIVYTYEHNQTKRTKQKCLTGGKRGKFVYIACPTNPLKGPELSILNSYAKTLLFGVSWPGMSQFILNILISCMYRTNGAHRMHRLMCIFDISRFQTIFSHEMTLFLKFLFKFER